ncbi:MAG: cellulose synthase family protein [Candidatus Methylacidiphilales bacterium]|nr:cellulose synthase family protein [Candidatus Methylacidiphilales bacterium]
MQILLLTLYLILAALLVMHSIHRVLMLIGVPWRKASSPGSDAEADGEAALHSTEPLPFVTVQLPIYNERHVVERLVRAAIALDYPSDLLEIQVLDDSTDDTVRVAAHLVNELAAEGVAIRHIHRTHRQGFKAGALKEGLEVARGEFIAIFDADFVPDPDFLRNLLPRFTSPRIGLVQARWGHLNLEYSLLTRVQAFLIDGHFLIEQVSRHKRGLFFNFNGTAGIWRKSCILDAGNWHADTLTEDLDLSYRAQLRGWQFRYFPQTVAPGELPPDIFGFKAQQRRWARGTVQTALKLLPRILREPLSLRHKWEAFMHFMGYSIHVIIALFAILNLITFTLIINDEFVMPLWLIVTFSAAALVSLAFIIGTIVQLQREKWLTTGLIPFFMSATIGMSVSNAIAVLEGFFNHPFEFVRTPKHALVGPGKSATSSDTTSRATPTSYGSPRQNTIVAVETIFALAYVAMTIIAIKRGEYMWLPTLILHAAGFSYVSALSLSGMGLLPSPARSDSEPALEATK